MFVNMRQPHVILAMRKDSGAARPTSDRGSVRGGVPVLRYGKSLGGYTVINVRSQIDNSDNEAETGTCGRTVHSPRTGTEPEPAGKWMRLARHGEEHRLGINTCQTTFAASQRSRWSKCNSADAIGPKLDAANKTPEEERQCESTDGCVCSRGASITCSPHETTEKLEPSSPTQHNSPMNRHSNNTDSPSPHPHPP